MLDKRLTAVAALVRRGSRLADIGTDHAYLPVWLVGSGYCPRAVAADIAQGPAETARQHIEAAGLSDRVTVRVGDGLLPVQPDEADDIVIAGMGGETMAAILQAAPWVKQPRLRLILQPMTKIPVLHGWLLANGFSILEETCTRDGRHDYVVLAAGYTQALPQTDPLAQLVGGLTARDGAPYLTRKLQYLRCAAAHGDAQAAALAKRLQTYMEESDG